jgi:hypothetical protein
MTPPAAETVQSIIQDFIFVTNAVYGTYLDASMAIGNLAVGYMQIHKEHVEKVQASGETITPQLLNRVLFYNAGPKEGEQRAIHQTTLVDIVERNLLNGRHMQFLARMCIVSLYQYWEDDFRPRLAKVIGQKPKHEVFGELRHLRRSIIHRGGRALPELATFTLLPRFEPDSELLLDQAAMDHIFNAVKEAASELLAGAA